VWQEIKLVQQSQKEIEQDMSNNYVRRWLQNWHCRDQGDV